MRNEIRKKLGTSPAPKEYRRPSGTIWPNGEFGLGFYTEYELVEAENEWAWTGDKPATGAEPQDLLPEDPLTLSDAPNSHKKGLKGLTTYGGRMVRSGCYLMERQLGKQDCMLWTFTVPTLGREARAELARNWGKLVNRLLGQLSRLLAKSGRKPAIIGCSEIQTGRLEKYRQGYLHLHLVCPAHSNVGGRFALDVQEVRSWFKKALERFAGCSIPQTPRVQAEIVKKSVEGYMGKYLSKGTGEELAGFIEDLGIESVPGQWWFCSALMRQAITKRVASGKNAGSVLDCVVQHAFETGDMSIFEYISHVDVEVDGVRYTAGWYGRLRIDIANDLRDFLSVVK